MDTSGIGGHTLHYEDGKMIFEESSAANEVYIIKRGKIEISRRISDRKTIIAMLGKGDLFGEMAMLNGAPRSTTAVSVGKTTLASFSVEEILQRMQDDRQFATTILQALINRLRSTTSKLLFSRTLIGRAYEFGDEFPDSVSPENWPVRIGEILMEMGCLTKLQLERVLQRQEEARTLADRQRLLGEIMVESGIVTDEQLRSALAEQQVRLRRRSE